VRSFHVIERFAPSSFARVLDGRKVLFVAEAYCGSACSASNGIIPRRNVQHEIPYAMRIRDGMRGGSHGIHVFQKFQDRVTVPGFSLESTTYLIRKSGRFSYRYVHADGFTRVTTTEASCQITQSWECKRTASLTTNAAIKETEFRYIRRDFRRPSQNISFEC
jgi:hypothetical protein